MHTNMFMFGHSRAEVKAALNQHQKRDSGILKALDLVLGICVLYLVRDLPRWDAAAIFVAVFSGLSGIRYFVDQSVRNFYLHRLEWEEAGPDDPAAS